VSRAGPRHHAHRADGRAATDRGTRRDRRPGRPSRRPTRRRTAHVGAASTAAGPTSSACAGSRTTPPRRRRPPRRQRPRSASRLPSATSLPARTAFTTSKPTMRATWTPAPIDLLRPCEWDPRTRRRHRASDRLRPGRRSRDTVPTRDLRTRNPGVVTASACTPGRSAPRERTTVPRSGHLFPLATRVRSRSPAGGPRGPRGRGPPMAHGPHRASARSSDDEHVRAAGMARP